MPPEINSFSVPRCPVPFLETFKVAHWLASPNNKYGEPPGEGVSDPLCFSRWRCQYSDPRTSLLARHDGLGLLQFQIIMIVPQRIDSNVAFGCSDGLDAMVSDTKAIPRGMLLHVFGLLSRAP